MKLQSNLWMLLMTLVLQSLPAAAGMPGVQDSAPYKTEFKSLDKDSNDKLSPAEAKQDKTYAEGGFASADKNHNGSLSYDEYANYKSAVQQKETKRALSDSAITSKIKSKYLVEKNFRSFDVSVKTKDGVVILSGFVKDQSTKTRAEQIARATEGVKSVQNSLVVKP